MDAAQPQDDGEALFIFLRPTIDRAIAAVCKRGNVRADETEEVASRINDKLIDKSYAVLRKFRRRSHWYTYLVSVSYRVLLDYRIEKFGKWRPSSEARRRGRLGVLLDRLLYRDDYQFHEACAVIRINYQLDVSQATLDELYAALPSHPSRRRAAEELLEDMATPGPSPDTIVIQNERRSVVDAIFAALDEAIRAIDSTEERLLLASISEDGQTVAGVARLLGYDKRQQQSLYPRRDELCRKLRKTLEDQGFNRDLVREILNMDRPSD